MWLAAGWAFAAVVEVVGAVLLGLFGGRLVAGDVGLYVGGGLGVLVSAVALRKLVRRVRRDDP